MGEGFENGDTHTMHCMEIWGGNKAVRKSVTTPGLDIWVYSEPYQAESRGGDVHYVTLCGGGLLTRLIVADVSGHGESVAIFSDALRSFMRRYINSKSQKRLVKALNRQFAEMAQLQRFATAVLATYVATTDRLAICNAAHPRPLLYRASEGVWSVLSDESASAMNLPLGIDEDSTYDQFVVQLEKGDYVVLYTDALTEAMSPEGTLIGEEGFLNLVRGLAIDRPALLGSAILDGLRDHRRGEGADDDVTLLVLHHNGGPPRRPSIGEKLDIYAKVFGLKSF